MSSTFLFWYFPQNRGAIARAAPGPRCRLRACHFSCFASSFEKGGTMKSERRSDNGGSLGRLLG